MCNKREESPLHRHINDIKTIERLLSEEEVGQIGPQLQRLYAFDEEAARNAMGFLERWDREPEQAYVDWITYYVSQMRNKAWNCLF